MSGTVRGYVSDKHRETETSVEADRNPPRAMACGIGLCAALLLLNMGAAKADCLPSSGCYRWQYNSTDKTPITLNLVRQFRYDRLIEKTWWGGWRKAPDAEQQIAAATVLRTKIPRAYITYCGPYSSRALNPYFKVSQIPDNAVCDAVRLSYIYPTGEPLTTFGRIDENEPLPVTKFFGSGYNEINDTSRKLRYLRMTAYIVRFKQSANRFKMWSPDDIASHSVRRKDYQGFNQFESKVGISVYFFDNSEDGIRKVRCIEQYGKIIPYYFCSVEFSINENIYVDLDLIDFRKHGGREFLRERVRNFKSHMCSILQCNEQALRAATIAGPWKE